METVSNMVGYVLAYLAALTDTQQTALTVLVAVGVMGSLSAIAIWDKRRTKRAYRKWRGANMTRKERIQYRKVIVANIITNGLEEAIFQGLLTRWDVQEEYKKLGKLLGNRELLPHSIKPGTLKDRIRESRANRQAIKPVAIPGPKPGEGVPTAEIIPIRRKFGERALRRKLAS